MKIRKININDLTIAFISLFVLYVFWYSGTRGDSLFLLYGTSVLATLLVGMQIIKSNDFYRGFKSIIPLLLCFGLYSILSGVIVCSNQGYFFSSIKKYLAFSCVCFDVCYISNKKKSWDWLLKIFLIVSLICVLQTILFGAQMRSSGVYVTTMGLKNNPNSLGLVMIIGIFSNIMLKGWKNSILVTTVLNLLYIYVAVLCGSRKCLICVAILFFSWYIIQFVDWKTYSSPKKFLLVLVTVCGIGVVIYYLRTMFITSSIYSRFAADALNEGISDRSELINRAVSLWKENPFFGVGYDQYKIVSGLSVVSHSTYAELLACSGLGGCIIWFGFGVNYFVKIFKNRKLIKCKYGTYHFIVAVLMIAIELFLGAGQIWFYDFSHLLILTYLIGHLLVEQQSFSIRRMTR